jgi:Phycobilisome protein
MHPDLQTLLYKAEAQYLEATEIKLFRHHIGSLSERLATYEILRNQELAIFQAIADQLQTTFPQESPQLLEKCLKQWIAILRYAAMAMLLNNPEFLQWRILEWLTDSVQAHQVQSIEAKLCQLLQVQLKNRLSTEQQGLIQPLIDQAQTNLLGSPTLYNSVP